jgi:hypothetical protein
MPMTRNGALILFGVLVILSPFSGLPFSFLQWLFVIFGAGIVLIGVSLRKAHVNPPASGLPQGSLAQSSVETEKQIGAPAVDTTPTQPSQIS